MAKTLVDSVRYDTLELLAVELQTYTETAYSSSIPDRLRSVQINRSAEKIERLLNYLQES